MALELDGPKSQAAGCGDNGSCRSAGNAQRDQQRINRGHQQKTESDRRVHEQCDELADEVSQSQQDIRRANGLQGLNAQLNQCFAGADTIHINSKAGNGHDVEA